MSVSLEGMRAFVGAGGTDDALILECMGEAVGLLGGYLRHLRVRDDSGAVVGKVTAAPDDPENPQSWTWTDTRELDDDDPTGNVPIDVLDRATREVASDLFTRRNAPNGILNMQFAGPDGPTPGPARLNRDPLTPAYPLLGRWVIPF